MRGLKSLRSGSLSFSSNITCEQLEPRCLMSVTAVGVNSAGVAKVAKPYVFATFTTTDSPLKAKNYTATVNFGDTTEGTAKIKLAKGVFSVVASHKYLVGPEPFAAGVTVTDKLDGTSETVQANVQIKAAPNHSPFTQYVGSLADEFETAYGGTWTQSGNNYRDGSLSAVRTSDRKDIIWSSNIVSAIVVSTNSPGDSQQFGFFPGSSGEATRISSTLPVPGLRSPAKSEPRRCPPHIVWAHG